MANFCASWPGDLPWKGRIILSTLGVTAKAMCFFFYVSRHFFFTKPTRARGKKTKGPKKKKHWLSVPDYLTDKWHTKLIVLSAVILLFIFYHTMIKLNSFQSPRKLDFSWYLTSLRRQRTCSNRQPKRSSTLRMYSSCRDRSLDGKLDRGFDSRPNTYPDVFVKARPHYYQQSLRLMTSTERILAFWFSATRQCNSLASA